MSIPGAASPLFLATTAGAADAFEISRSLRFNSADSAHLSKTFASAGNRKTWTFSFWLKRTKFGALGRILRATSGSSEAGFQFLSDDIELYNYAGGYTWQLKTTQVFRDPSAWYHFVVAFNTTQATASDRVSFYINGSKVTNFATSNYPSQNFDDLVNNNIAHSIFGSDAFPGGYLAEINFIDGQALAPTDFGETDANGVWQAKEYVSSGSPNAFGKIWSNDLTANTGFQSSYPAINAFDGIFTANNSEGRAAANNAASVLTFSPTGGIAVNSKIEVYTRDGTITVNGGSGYSSSSSLAWKDVSSVSPSTPFTLTTLTVTGSSGNAGEIYAIRVDGTVLLNNAGWGINGFRLPFTDTSSTEALGYDQKETVTLSPKGGMNVVTYTGTGSARSIGGLIFQPDLVWIKERGSTGDHHLFDSVRGATKALRSNETDAEVTDANELTAFNSDGFSLGSGGDVNANGTTTVAWTWNAGANSNKTYTVKVVSDSGNKYRFDNFGTSAVTLDLAEGSTYIFDQSDSSNAGHPIRFGTSSNGTDYTTGVTHTGTPGSAGAKTTLVLASGAATLYYSCLNHSGMGGQINTNSAAGASNFDGSIQANVKASTDYGFSIVKWTATNGSATIGHGLNTAPEFIVIKDRDASTFWQVYHSSLGNTKAVNLNSTNAASAAANHWNNTSPTSTTFSVGVNSNYLTDDHIAYVWSEVAGFSKFGSYSGSSAAGNAQNLGFKPRWVMIKSSTSSTDEWVIFDSARPLDKYLYANSSSAEASYSNRKIEISNTGFSFTGSDQAINTSGQTYIYAAYADRPGNNWTPNNLSVGIANGSYISGTISAGSSDGSILEAFDGVLTRTSNAAGITAANGNLLTYTLPSSISYSSKVEIAAYNNSVGTAYLGLGTANPTSGGITAPNVANGGSVPYTTLATGSGSFSAVSVINTSERVGWVGLRIDGATVLIDNAVDSGKDVLFDSPSNGTQADTGIGGEVVGNYCTPNPLNTNSNVGFSDGNLNLNSTAGGWYSCTSTIGISSGKFYWEATAENNSSNALNSLQIGIAPADSDVLGSNAGSLSNGYGYQQANGNKMHNGTQTSYGSSASRGDVVMVAFDADNGKIWWGKNGTWFASGDPAAGTNAAYTSIASDTYIPVFSFDRGRWIVNMGARAFAYTAPSGYKALNTANLPTPTIADGSKFFDTTLWDGNATARSISTDFAPGFVWTKLRNTGNNHKLFDIVRGVEKKLESSTTNAEGTESGTLTAFNSDGFSLGTAGNVNGNSYTYVGWAWAGGTSTVTNNDGSVATQVRANPSAGFSIVDFTVPSGSGLKSYGHGLNAEPSLIITKQRNGTTNWQVFTNAAGSNQSLTLNSTAAAAAASSGNYAQSSSTFSLNNGVYTDTGWNLICYCFAPVAGYSAIGSYQGNGNANGPVVFTGFRPKFLLMKSAGAGNWVIIDSARDTYNIADGDLYPDESNAEGSNPRLDILSNGFKLRSTYTSTNPSGTSVIYIAFASNPFASNGGLAR